jgi:glycosyltransferase involved in cell wall biosynthesis
VRAELERYDGVEITELYERPQLDALLEPVDVGVMPSVWEEAFGYSGIEMLAKGIPLIANPVGGIPEYAREGETAWLNHSCSGEGLAELMSTLIAEPDQVVETHRRVVAARDRLVPSMVEHAAAIETIYHEAGVS